MNYTHEYSKLPIEIMDRHFFKDVDNTIAPLINQIKELQANCEYDKVNEIINQNISNLSQYVLSSDYMNAIDEETRNLEIFAKSKKQQIFYDNEVPEYASELDIWIGGN